MLTLIAYKHAKHAEQKELIDPKSQMIHAMQQWDKIAKEFQKRTKSKIQEAEQWARTIGMCSIWTTKNWQIIT